MKTLLNILILCASVLLLAACASNPRPSAPPVPAEVTNLATIYPGEETTLSELDATAKLDLPSNRLERFMSLAHRSSLGPAGQIYLVDLTWSKLESDAQRKSVILTLVANSGFCNAGKRQVLGTLAKFSSDDDKKAVLDAIDQRGELGK